MNDRHQENDDQMRTKMKACLANPRWVVGLLAIVSATLLLAACGSTPDWEALYAERLGRPIAEIDESTLGEEFTDPTESGALTRAAWVQFPNSTMALLGLPAHRFEPEEVVERTVVLEQEEWQRACAEALGMEEVEGWRLPHAHRPNSVRIYLNNHNDRYCEFFFLPDGWELRTVQSEGIVRSFRQP